MHNGSGQRKSCYQKKALSQCLPHTRRGSTNSDAAQVISPVQALPKSDRCRSHVLLFPQMHKLPSPSHKLHPTRYPRWITLPFLPATEVILHLNDLTTEKMARPGG